MAPELGKSLIPTPGGATDFEVAGQVCYALLLQEGELPLAQLEALCCSAMASPHGCLVLADTETPVSVWLKLFANMPYNFLLESGAGGPQRRSFRFLPPVLRTGVTVARAHEDVGRLRERLGRDIRVVHARLFLSVALQFSAGRLRPCHATLARVFGHREPATQSR